MKRKKMSFNLLCKVTVIVFPIVMIIAMMGISKATINNSIQEDELLIAHEEMLLEKVSPDIVIIGSEEYLHEGNLALSISGSGFKPGDIIYVDGIPCNTTFGDRNWLTCIVDEELYLTPGVMKVSVCRNQDGTIVAQSNSVSVEVKEKID